MSYFMTLGGQVRAVDPPGALRLIPAHEAQPYVVALEPELVALDGGPVFLVEDGETGTSDVAVADVVSALEDDVDVSAFAIFRLMTTCLSSGISFRVWWAGGNSPASHRSRVVEVENVEAAMHALKSGKGARWHPRSNERQSVS
jgi:hypothetical protein